MFKVDNQKLNIIPTDKIYSDIKKYLDKMPYEEMITTNVLLEKFNLANLNNGGTFYNKFRKNMSGYFVKYKNGYLWGSKKTITSFKKLIGQ